MERLRSETDAIDAMIGQHRDLVRRQRVGIALDGELGFAASIQRQPAENGGQQAFELGRAEVRGRAAAEEKRPHRLCLAQRGQLGGERVEIQFDEMILSGGDGEIAVAAVMGAEGDMDVGGARPQPGGQRRSRTYPLRAWRLHYLTRR